MTDHRKRIEVTFLECLFKGQNHTIFEERLSQSGQNYNVCDHSLISAQLKNEIQANVVNKFSSPSL